MPKVSTLAFISGGKPKHANIHEVASYLEEQGLTYESLLPECKLGCGEIRVEPGIGITDRGDCLQVHVAIPGVGTPYDRVRLSPVQLNLLPASLRTARYLRDHVS